MIHKELTEKIIKAFYAVYNKLGFGFLERVYENSMVIELNKMGLTVKKQFGIDVHYDGILVGNYFADLIVENIIVCEMKAQEQLAKENELQLINYLKATSIEIGLLFNFGKNPEFRRKIFGNSRKSF